MRFYRSSCSSDDKAQSEEPLREVDIEALARQLEQAFRKLNLTLLDVVDSNSETIVDAFIDTQARLLGLDDHARRTFASAVEEARVKTLSQGNIFVSCALCSAIALSQLKQQPLPASGLWRRPTRRLRRLSTHAVSLGAFAMLSFYALLGRKSLSKARQWWKNRPLGL